MKDYMIYDCEVKNAIPCAGQREDGIKYCSGWSDFDNMGISCICTYESWSDRYRVFCEDNLSEFKDIVGKRCFDVIGFNSESFDDRLCNANGIKIKTDYDILRQFYVSSNLDPYPERYSAEYKGYSLSNISKVNFGTWKSDNGADVPVSWQRGETGKVIDHCVFDVSLCKKIYDMVLSGQFFVLPNTGRRVVLYNPAERS